MNVTCQVIRDLMPSFVDEICSEDSRDLINEHIQTCKSCKDFLESMKQPVMPAGFSQENDKLKAQKPFRKINKMHRIKMLIVALAVMALTITGMMAVMDIGVLHDAIFPHQTAVINEEEDIGEWKAISLEENGYLNYDSIFYKKKVTNSASSDSRIKIRIVDLHGNIVLDEQVIEPGTSIKLNKLKNHTDYIVEIQVDAGRYMLDFR